ncbi:alpha/beta hydrolase [Pseudonocardia ailaonensis]|uniref:Alpha/beta hydrolase n=1 Tax=Pseudonocardia ailaonensis TaxID=367279 RepID=A0ABN2N7T3_9PSEU
MTPGPIIPLPAPAYLSDAARAALEQPIMRNSFPALDDALGWEEHITMLESHFTGVYSKALPVRSEAEDIAGVPNYVIVPDDADPEGPIYLDIHGGGLIIGKGDLARAMSEPNAVITGLVHWAPDYRMPPAHPYPAALDDLVTVYRHLLTERSTADIVIGGGSGGGNLAAALICRARDEGLPVPAGLVLVTPQLDLTESGDSFETLKDLSVACQSLMQPNLLYADGHDLAHPYLSPLFGDLRGFPPTLLISGTRDLFLSNTVRMHRALRDTGVSADLHVIDARPHSGFGDAPEEASVAMEIRKFVRRQVSR